MKPQPEEAAQLLAAGERDRVAFQILNRDSESPNEILLFHAQQAAEKFIKAVLAARGLVYRRTHDLVELASLAANRGLNLPIDPELLVRIGPYAVEFRYLSAVSPEVSRTEAEAMIESLRRWARREIDVSSDDRIGDP
jgi:HEPN domain-containing protein